MTFYQFDIFYYSEYGVTEAYSETVSELVHRVEGQKIRRQRDIWRRTLLIFTLHLPFLFSNVTDTVSSRT